MYSALKVNGKKLYELARRGQQIERANRQIEIHALTLLEQTGENRYLIQICCSRGTYIRTLCEDIGTRLNACAHMSFLLRAKAGDFCVSDAFSIDELMALKEQGRLHEAVTPVETAVAFLPELNVDDDAQRKLKHGCVVPIVDANVAERTQIRVYGDVFLGIGVLEQEQLKLAIQF